MSINERRVEIGSKPNSDATTAAIIKEMEDKFPLTTERFKEIQALQYETFCKKQKNYGPNNISLRSDLSTDADRLRSLQGLWFRMNDKHMRLEEMVFNGAEDAVGEARTDTYLDLSVYGIIAILVENGIWGK